jgi:hypothetical protein
LITEQSTVEVVQRGDGGWGVVLEALSALGAIDGRGSGSRDDGWVEIAGRRVRLETVGTSVARPGWARGLGAPPSRVLGVVVADQVPAPTRAVLDDLGWGWLDRRGHIKLRRGQLWIDADVPPNPRVLARAAQVPLAGPVAFGVALMALTSAPTPLAGIRAVARQLGASPAGVSAAAARLIDAGLLTRDRRAPVPDLFWAVADAWRPAWVGLAEAPVSDASGHIVAVGCRAAAQLGAPIALTVDYPVELLAADQDTAAAAIRRVGGVVPLETAPTRLAVGPSHVAAVPAEAAGAVDGVPVAGVVVVGLTLAGDPARGAEILEGWDAPGRVW